MSIQFAQNFDVGDFYHRLATRLDHAKIANEVDGDHLIEQNLGIAPRPDLKPAAVLIPILEGETRPHILLTTRTLALKSHSGQIAFPGGKIDAGDETPAMAALREAHEEVGLLPNQVKVLNQMPNYKSGSGYEITPVIGKIEGQVKFTPNPDEVEDCFTVPLDFLMNGQNHILASKVWNNQRRYFYEMPYEDEKGKARYIWGVTAGIIRRLYERLYL